MNEELKEEMTAQEQQTPEAEVTEEKKEEIPEAPEAEETEAEEAETADGQPLKRRERKAFEAELKKLRAENADLTKKAEEAQKLADETKDKYLRTVAEYDNYRKRTARERDGIYGDARADTVKELFPLFDNLTMASKYSEGEQFVQGVQMILAQIPEILGKMGIETFGKPGETFDANLHNAVMHIEDEEHGEQEIVEVFQCGYKQGDKVIRYAMVKVAN